MLVVGNMTKRVAAQADVMVYPITKILKYKVISKDANWTLPYDMCQILKWIGLV